MDENIVVDEKTAITQTSQGVTVLTADSKQFQYFTGTVAEKVVLPDASTMAVDAKFIIVNQTPGDITIHLNSNKPSGANLVQTVGTGESYSITCVKNSGNPKECWESSNSVVEFEPKTVKEYVQKALNILNLIHDPSASFNEIKSNLQKAIDFE